MSKRITLTNKQLNIIEIVFKDMLKKEGTWFLMTAQIGRIEILELLEYLGIEINEA